MYPAVRRVLQERGMMPLLDYLVVDLVGLARVLPKLEMWRTAGEREMGYSVQSGSCKEYPNEAPPPVLDQFPWHRPPHQPADASLDDSEARPSYRRQARAATTSRMMSTVTSTLG